MCAVNHEEGMSREVGSERLGVGTCVVNRGRGVFDRDLDCVNVLRLLSGLMFAEQNDHVTLRYVRCLRS